MNVVAGRKGFSVQVSAYKLYFLTPDTRHLKPLVLLSGWRSLKPSRSMMFALARSPHSQLENPHKTDSNDAHQTHLPNTLQATGTG